MQFALFIGCGEFVEATVLDCAAEFCWALDGETWFFSEYNVPADVKYGVEFNGFFWAEGFGQFLLYLGWCVVNEDAGFGFAFAHFRAGYGFSFLSFRDGPHFGLF